MFRTVLLLSLLLLVGRLFAQNALMEMQPSVRVVRILDFAQKQLNLSKDQLAGVQSVLENREEARQGLYQKFLHEPPVGQVIADDGNPVIGSLEKFHAEFDGKLLKCLTPDQYMGLMKIRRESAMRRIKEMQTMDGNGFFYDFEFNWN